MFLTRPKPGICLSLLEYVVQESIITVVVHGSLSFTGSVLCLLNVYRVAKVAARVSWIERLRTRY